MVNGRSWSAFHMLQVHCKGCYGSWSIDSMAVDGRSSRGGNKGFAVKGEVTLTGRRDGKGSTVIGALVMIEW